MALTPLGPLPTQTDTATFDSRMDSFINTQLPRMVTEVDVISAAFNFNATNATSSTSLLIGTGSKSLTIETNKSLLPGMYMVCADAAAPSTNSMFGQVTSYNSGTGALVFNSLSITGSGTKASWLISQGQVLQYGGQDALTTAGTAPNYTATPTPALTAYVANKVYPVFFHAAGVTGSNAISFSGLGNRNLKQLDSSGTKIPAIIPAPMGSYLLYDGTDFILLDPLLPAATSKIQSIASSVSANALTLTYNGGTLDFRSPTLSNGVPNTVTISANSITVPSGATLGTVSGQQTTLVLLEAYNGGSPVACIANLAGGLNLDETNLISPTTISAGANSAGVIYSASAVSASSPYRVVGFVNITETTAGTWATAPTLVQGHGGLAALTLTKNLGKSISGTISGVGTTNGTTGSVTFSSTFTTVPVVVSSPTNGTGCFLGITSVSTSGFNYVVNNHGNSGTTTSYSWNAN